MRKKASVRRRSPGTTEKKHRLIKTFHLFSDGIFVFVFCTFFSVGFLLMALPVFIIMFEFVGRNSSEKDEKKKKIFIKMQITSTELFCLCSNQRRRHRTTSFVFLCKRCRCARATNLMGPRTFCAIPFEISVRRLVAKMALKTMPAAIFFFFVSTSSARCECIVFSFGAFHICGSDSLLSGTQTIRDRIIRFLFFFRLVSFGFRPE